MYTEYVGQQLLRVWLGQTGEELTAREFFDTQLFPLFFASDKMLQWVVNSPFTQRFPDAQRLAGREERAYQLEQLHRLAEQTTGPPDASFAVGFPAAGTTATTSGQVWDRAPRADAEAIYRSWLGAALGIGVAGGLCLLLTDADVLWALCEGWAHYRRLLDQHPQVKGNQVESWNGQWLAHVLSDRYDPNQPLAGFDFAALLDEKGGVMAIRPHPWVALLFALAQHLPGPQATAYVYALGKTNRTVGFIPLRLAEIRTLPQLYHRLFNLSGTGEQWAALSEAYETRLGLAAACEAGSLGLVALEPARLRDAVAAAPGPANSPAAARRQETYQLWLAAMLHQDSPDATPSVTLPEAADRLALALLRYAAHEPGTQKRGITKYERLVEQVFDNSLPGFIRQLTDLLKATPAAAEFREEFMEAVHLVGELAPARFAVFMSLLRFRYVAHATA